MTTTAVRRELRYRGHVQGVGFRYTAAQIARRFRVAGYVKNLEDGRVELIVEGSREEIDAFLASVASAMRGNIRDVEQDTLAPTGEFSEFGIRHE
jgi:acylphosphatase